MPLASTGQSTTSVDRPEGYAAACVPTMFSPEVELSVSIVSYRAPGPLRACLDALAAERDHVDLDVTVVDNAPGDGSAEMVKREFPWVRLIGNARNVGFGAAHNQVLREAHGRYWLILNSDTAVQLGALATLVAAMDAQPDVAVAGPKLRHQDGEVQPSRRRFPTT